MSDKLRLHVGDKIKAIMPWSEVCMHLGIAGKTMICEILGRGVRVYDEAGNVFSFPITHGEAGFNEGTQIGDSEMWWYTSHPQGDVEKACTHDVTVSGKCLVCHPDLQGQVDGGV